MVIEKIMPAVGAGQPGPEAPAAPQAGNGEVESPIPGVSPELFKTLSQRHSLEVIQEKRAGYQSEKDFLADAEKEAEHIRFTLAKQAASATSTLTSKPLSVGQEVHGKIVDKDVLENAQLWDAKRQEAAAKLLGKELSDKQKQELIEAHWESAGEKGQDEGHLAGVYNLTRKQIRREVEKLPSFSREERRKLFEAGLVGRIPSAEYRAFGFDASLYSSDPILADIAELIEETGVAGDVNEEFVDRIINRAENNSDQGRTNRTLTRNLVREVTRLRRVAERTPEPDIPTPPSHFQDVQAIILRLEAVEATRPLTTAEQTNLVDARSEREVLIREVAGAGVTENIRDQDYLLYRGIRIDVPPTEKDFKLKELLAQQQQAEIRPMETKEYWAALTKIGLSQDRHGGLVDYIRRGDLALVRAVFDNPASPVYPNNGISVIWEGFTPRDESGRAFPGIINNFDDVRKFIEAERKSRPRYVGSRSNWLLPIEFIVDGIDELPEAIEDYAVRLEKETLAGSVENIQTSLQERHSWDEKAMQAFMRHFNKDKSDPIIIWASSRLNSIVDIVLANLMAGMGKEGAKNYVGAMKMWGEGFKTEDSTGKQIGENFFDVLYFEHDTNGWMPVALDQLTSNHGEYWRYGSNSLDHPKRGERKSYQRRREKEIVELMAKRELKPIDVLLATHPAFIAFRAEVDSKDPTGALWSEYVGEARAWERFVRGIDKQDGRNPEASIIFEHPLARSLTKAEFDQMYQALPRLAGETDSQYNKRIKDRAERATVVLKRAERVATALMIDSEATSARIVLKDAAGNKTGETKSFSQLVDEEVMKIVRKDEFMADGVTPKPLGKRKFKAYYVLHKLGLVDFPTYGAFDIGSDDTGRNDLIRHFLDEPELETIIDAKTIGPNAKTTIVRWIEDERRIITLVERAVRRAKKIPTKDSHGNDVFADGTDYENFPGNNTPGGGIKYFKNDILYPYYGVSRDTVRVNGLITAAYYGVGGLLGEYGCKDEQNGNSFLRFVAWQKRRNELELGEEGPAFRNPDSVNKWIDRVASGLKQSALWTSSGSDQEHPEGLLLSVLKGPFRLRGKNYSADTFGKTIVDPMKDPEDAYNLLTEAGYTDYLALIGDVFSKVETVMKARRDIENIYGMAPGTAAFLNTLTWYDVLDWMQYFKEEFRGKFGYAIDVSQYLSRYLANTALCEDGTIFSDDDWWVIMNGGFEGTGEGVGKVKMLGGGDGPMQVAKGEGLLNFIPEYLRAPIAVGAGKYLIDPIPMSDRFRPKVLDLRGETDNYKKKYGKAYMHPKGKILKD